MRLPRPENDAQGDEGRSDTPKAEAPAMPQQSGVLWNTRPSSTSTPPQKAVQRVLGEDEQYKNFIATVS
jgi:hypothetical protein